MMFRKIQNLFPVLCAILLWRFGKVKSYVDVCEETYPGVFCTCETSHRETTITCFLINDLPSTDYVWESLGNIDNVVALKLHSRLPVRLDYIPLKALKQMPKLEALTIQEANLGELQAYAVSDLPNLHDLNLEGNDITDLQSNAITRLPKLKKLTLSTNLLQELLAESMSELLELEELFLDRNNISRIEACAFCDLQNLKELELWGNQITDLTEYTFRGLRYLRRLDLYKNQIKILNDKIFQSMPKLVELDLKDNMISHISPRAFLGLHKLQRLILNMNRLKMLPDEVFKPLSNLRFVDLYNNVLETLQGEVVKHCENGKDEHFLMAFKENPYTCDCRLHWVKTYLKLNKSRQFSRELQEVQCVSDGEINQTVIKYLSNVKCDGTHASKSKTLISTSRSVTKTTDTVPNELNSRKAKTVAPEEEERKDEKIMKSEIVDGGDAACCLSPADFFVTFTALLIALYIQKCKEL